MINYKLKNRKMTLKFDGTNFTTAKFGTDFDPSTNKLLPEVEFDASGIKWGPDGNNLLAWIITKAYLAQYDYQEAYFLKSFEQSRLFRMQKCFGRATDMDIPFQMEISIENHMLVIMIFFDEGNSFICRYIATHECSVHLEPSTRLVDIPTGRVGFIDQIPNYSESCERWFPRPAFVWSTDTGWKSQSLMIKGAEELQLRMLTDDELDEYQKMYNKGVYSKVA